jgi:catechol 2,3-dioxygenase-like lactoylglutathione lyase family enzyme
VVKYRMSPNVAVRGSDVAAAVEFYSGVLGFPVRGTEPMDVDADPLTLFLIGDDDMQGPVLELFVDDLDAARAELVAKGCEVIRWRGRGQDCYLRDPFGVTFNLWEDPVP